MQCREPGTRHGPKHKTAVRHCERKIDGISHDLETKPKPANQAKHQPQTHTSQAERVHSTILLQQCRASHDGRGRKRGPRSQHHLAHPMRRRRRLNRQVVPYVVAQGCKGHTTSPTCDILYVTFFYPLDRNNVPAHVVKDACTTQAK